MCLQFPADFFCLFHDAQQIAAKDFANVVVLVALAHQGLCDFREFRAILHAVGHRRPIKVRAEADVVRPDKFHDMVDVVDDSFPTDVRQSTGSFGLGLKLFDLATNAFSISTAFLRNLFHGGNHTACPTTDLHLWRLFAQTVHHEYTRGDFRKTWGR